MQKKFLRLVQKVFNFKLNKFMHLIPLESLEAQQC